MEPVTARGEGKRDGGREGERRKVCKGRKRQRKPELV